MYKTKIMSIILTPINLRRVNIISVIVSITELIIFVAYCHYGVETTVKRINSVNQFGNYFIDFHSSYSCCICQSSIISHMTRNGQRVTVQLSNSLLFQLQANVQVKSWKGIHSYTGCQTSRSSRAHPSPDQTIANVLQLYGLPCS